MRTIGVLGGMGPQATILLQQRLIDAVEADDDADHIPLIVDMNPQVPSRLDHLLRGTGADPAPVLARMAERLTRAGAEALIMPCNTAHHFAPAILAATNVPFLDMVALSVARVGAAVPYGARVGILASPATEDIKLFTTRFEATGLKALHPPAREALVTAIKAVKSSGSNAQTQDILRAAALDCHARGAQALVIGCSEFSLDAAAAQIGLPVIDTLDVLAEAAVAYAKGG